MHNWFWVGLGGALGAMARYGVSLLWLEWGITQTLPLIWSTLLVNFVGCSLGGVMLAILMQGHLWALTWKLFMVTGFLGGFTTFSAFAIETLQLVIQEQWSSALLQILFHLGGSLLGVALGYFLALQVLK